MSIYRQLVAAVLFPLHERLKRHDTIAVYKAMERSQWLSPNRIAELQLANLQRFLHRIGTTVPYYEKLFADSGLDPTAVSSTADLQRLPLLDKRSIRAHSDTLQARNALGLKRFNTGGSSGEPLIFYLGRERVSHDVAAKRRATRWWDVDVGDAEIVVWGSPIELGAQDRVRGLRDKIFRTQLLSAFEMSGDNLDRFVARIMAVRPAMLFGYPSALSVIAEHALRGGQDLSKLGIKVVFVTSERLYDHQRDVISTVFGCPVANGYGARDAGFIAHECPHGRMHITAEDIVLEIVDPSGTVLAPGQAGEIVVTHLFTRDFPFVRYRTGDIGVVDPEPCTCGRGLPVLAAVEGRTTDFLVACDGTLLHGLALIYVLRDMPGVEEFKIVQETLHHTRVVVIAGAADKAYLQSTIERQFRARLGSEVTVTVEFVQTIASEKSGKFRYVVSHVAQERSP